MYVELIDQIHDVFDALPCRVCHFDSRHIKTHAIDARIATLVGIPIGIYHPACAYYLRSALNDNK